MSDSGEVVVCWRCDGRQVGFGRRQRQAQRRAARTGRDQTTEFFCGRTTSTSSPAPPPPHTHAVARLRHQPPRLHHTPPTYAAASVLGGSFGPARSPCKPIASDGAKASGLRLFGAAGTLHVRILIGCVVHGQLSTA